MPKIVSDVRVRLYLGFTPYKAEQSLHEAWSYKKKKYKMIKQYRKSVKEPTDKRCMLTLDLKPFRS